MAMRRIAWFIGLVVGVLLIAAAGVVRWTVAPAVTVLPSNLDTTRIYTGTASTLFNPTAAIGQKVGPALLHNVPLTVGHTDKVIDTKGNNALVTDRKYVTMPGYTGADVTYRYAIDRKSFGAGSGFTDVVKQNGVTFNWPIHTQKHDYTGWVSDTQSTTTLTYAGTAKRGGVETYVFKANVPTTRITDPQTLARLPKSMTKAQIMTLVPSLGLKVADLKQMSGVLDKLPDPVPFAYTFSSPSTYYVAPDSGVVVDVVSREIRSAAFDLGGTLAAVGPVMDFTYTSTPATLKAAANDAKDNASKMQLISTTLPLIALIVGIALAAISLVGLMAAIRRHHAETARHELPEQITPVS